MIIRIHMVKQLTRINSMKEKFTKEETRQMIQLASQKITKIA